jgi:hypothetical protein
MAEMAETAEMAQTIDLKRITRYKLALIFTSADHRKFLCLFGSEAARLLTSNEATLEGYEIKQVYNHCDSIMKNVNNKKKKTKNNDLLMIYYNCSLKTCCSFLIIYILHN